SRITYVADSVQPVILNVGLDTVSPPILAAEGSVSDCLNYEITDIAGYRRIDGYENYDGFPNGAISFYVRVRIEASQTENQEFITQGGVLYRSNDGLNPVAIGIIL